MLGPRHSATRASLAGAGLVASLQVVGMLETHKLGHRCHPHPLMQARRRTTLVLSPEHHLRHHEGDHDRSYCVVNGWGGRTFGRIGGFRMLERAIQRLTGALPRRDDRRLRSAGRLGVPAT